MHMTTTAPNDPRWLQVHRTPTQLPDVPYVPTDDAVVSVMLHLARVTPADTVYDLGCGDGRIVIAAARLGARAVGVDIDLQRIKECDWNAKRAGVQDRVQFVRASLFDIDIRPASVVTLYLLTHLNLKLRPKLLFDLQPGSRIVTNFFEMGDWPPDQTITAYKRTLNLYVIPTWIQGPWHCTIATPGRRHHMRLDLRRHYQRLTGTAILNRHSLAILGGHVDGPTLTFSLAGGPASLPATHFTATLTNSTLRGSCRTDSGATFPWCAMRPA
jgi:precorrin-6B methylase 2